MEPCNVCAVETEPSSGWSGRRHHMHRGAQLAHRLAELVRVDGRDVLVPDGLERAHHRVIGTLVEPAHDAQTIVSASSRPPSGAEQQLKDRWTTGADCGAFARARLAAPVHSYYGCHVAGPLFSVEMFCRCRRGVAVANFLKRVGR